MTCQRCNGPMIEACDGRGYVFTDLKNEKTKDCPRLYAIRLAEHLGPMMTQIRHFSNSPLCIMGPKGQPPIADLTKTNLFIKQCQWTTFLPHFKWALVCKGLDFKYRLVEDRRLLDVWLGSEDFRSKPASKRNVVETCNSLTDLIGPEYDLVVIRLGFLGYKNKAAPGVLHEALKLRQSLNKPVWLIEESEWDLTRDENVDYFLKKHFQTIELPVADPGPGYKPVDSGIETSTDVDDATIETLLDQQVEQRFEPSVLEDASVDEESEEPDLDLDLALPGRGSSKFKGSNWRKKSGGGPV